MRNLEREIANLARKAVKEIVAGEQKQVTITRRNLEKYAGVRKFRYGEAELEDMVGVTTGLAWTEVGGELLTIEAVHGARQGQDDHHRQARRRDAGIGAGGEELCPLALAPARHQAVAASRRPTSTSTCRKAPRPRTGRRPASPW